jgi:trehalose 6-phosphate synthase
MPVKLILHSAWWGESFVTELRRISETSDRKVRFGPVTTTADTIEPSKTEGKSFSEHPLRQEMTIPERAKESEPITAPIDGKKDADAPADDMADGLPSQPTNGATQ